MEEGKFGTTCTTCGLPTTMCCSRCRAAPYCSRACQIAAWPEHKLRCQQAQKSRRTSFAAETSRTPVPNREPTPPVPNREPTPPKVVSDLQADVLVVAALPGPLPTDVVASVLCFLPLRARCQALRIGRDWRDTGDSNGMVWTDVDYAPGKAHFDETTETILHRASGRVIRFATNNIRVVRGPIGPLMRLLALNVRLVDVTLTGCRLISGAALLEHLPPSVEQLRIDGCSINPEQLGLLRERLPALRTIDVAECCACASVLAPAIRCAGTDCDVNACSNCAADDAIDEWEQCCDACDEYMCPGCFDISSPLCSCSECETSVRINCMSKRPLVFCSECQVTVCFDCLPKRPMMNCSECFKVMCVDCLPKCKQPMMHCSECFDMVCLDCMPKKPLLHCSQCFTMICLDCLPKAKTPLMNCCACFDMVCIECFDKAPLSLLDDGFEMVCMPCLEKDPALRARVGNGFDY